MVYTLYNNKDTQYDLPNPRRSGSEVQCQAFCDASANCAGFSYVTNEYATTELRNTCSLKHTDALFQTVTDSPNVNLYSKNLNLESIASYSYNQNNPNYGNLYKYATDNHVDLSGCDSLATSEQPGCKIELIQKHMRDNIDRKVAEIYQAHGTNTLTLDENYRNTMMIGVVWAMLGTTVLYYTFKNL